MQDLTSWSIIDHENGEESAKEDLVSDLKAASTIVTKKTIGNTTLWRTEILQHPRGPPAQESTVQACLKFANDSEENWVKVLWSDENKIQLFGINSTHRVWKRRNAAYDPKKTSNMEVETLYFWGVFLPRGQDNCTASKGRWTGPCTSCTSQGIGNGSWMGIPAWQWPKTHGQGNKGVAQEEAH